MTESLFSEDTQSIDVQFYDDNEVFGRLLYLIDTLKIDLPNWLKYKLPFSNDISKPRVLWSPLLTGYYRKGSVYGEGSIEEIKQCLHKVVIPELKTYEEHNKFWLYLSSLADGLFQTNHEVWLEQIEKGQSIEKFNSGFDLFDQAVGGFYSSIVTVAGLPGAGKTSLLLSFMGKLAQHHPIWYFQTEIPYQLISSRISLVKPDLIQNGCKVFCGNYSSESILELVKKNPDPNRIIIYDSPEIKTSNLEPISYFEQVYQNLVSLKMCSKMVVVTSQTKQNVGWDDLGIYSLSDSAAKARYTDIILYIGRVGDIVLVKTGKNRFGELNKTRANYDYSSLQIKHDSFDLMFE